MAMKIETKVIKKANKYNWHNIDHQKNIFMLSFVKRKDKSTMRINVYYSKMTVATCIDHPKQGKTQLFRRNVTIEELEKIFENPRHHTGKGYHKK